MSEEREATTGRNRAVLMIVRVMAFLIVASLGIGALIAAVMLIDGDFSEFGARSIGMLTLVAAGSGCLIVLANWLRIGRMPLLMIQGMVLTVLAVTAWSAIMWFDPMPYDVRQVVARVAGALTVLCLAVVHFGTFVDLETDVSWLNWARWIMVALAGLVALMGLGTLIFVELMERYWPTYHVQVYAVTMFALAVVVVPGSVLLRIVFYLDAQRRRARRDSLSGTVRLSMECPQCASGLALPNGIGRCSSCGYALLVEIEEPRCDCGYLLYRLIGDTCPECGDVVPEDRRWSPHEHGESAAEPTEPRSDAATKG